MAHGAPTEKTCLRCKQARPLKFFNIDRSRKDGLHPYCTKCKTAPYAKSATRELRRQAIRARTEKRCSACKEIKPVASFTKSVRSLDGHASWCRACVANDMRLRRANDPKVRRREKAAYRAQRVSLLAASKKTRESRKTILIQQLGGACADCGIQPGDEWPPACFDFHHVDGTKEGNISHLMSKRSEALAMAESKKCVALCSNCHRRRHARRL